MSFFFPCTVGWECGYYFEMNGWMDVVDAQMMSKWTLTSCGYAVFYFVSLFALEKINFVVWGGGAGVDGASFVIDACMQILEVL